MSKIFKCHHCHMGHKKNLRIKGRQKYCREKECQRARKRKWDQCQRRKNPDYKSKRQASNRKWYSKYPGNKYQKEYRESHPGYCEENRRQQVLRNQKRQIPAVSPKIVKTDALTFENVSLQGLYTLLPYKKTTGKRDTKKIVKTDALIVQIIAGSGFAGGFPPGGS